MNSCVQAAFKGGSNSRKVQSEYLTLRKRYWVTDFGVKGIFAPHLDNVTNEVIMNYIENHSGN